MGGDEHLNGQKLHYEERLSKLRGQNQQIINETVQLRAKFRKSLQLLQVYQEKLVHGAAPQPGGDAAKRLQLFDSPQGGEPARPVAVTSQAQPLNPSSVESGARSRADAPLTTETARSRDASSDPDAVPFRTPPRDEPLAPALVSLDAKALQRLALDAKRELDARTAAYEAVVFASAPSARAVGARERETGGAGGDGAALGQLAAGLAQLGVHRADMPMLMAPTQLDGQRLAPEEALSASEVLSTPPPPSRSDRRALAGADALELAKPAAPAAGGDELDTLLELPALSLRTTTLALSPAQVPAVFLSPLPRALPAAPSPRAAQPAPPPSAERPRTDIAPARSSLLVRMPSTSACAAPTSTPGRVAVSQTAAPRRAPAATEPRARRPFAAAAAAAPLPPARAAEPAAPPPSHWQQSRAVAPPPHWQQLRAAVPAARTEPCALASARGGPHARAQLSAGFESVSDDGSDSERARARGPACALHILLVSTRARAHPPGPLAPLPRLSVFLSLSLARARAQPSRSST